MTNRKILALGILSAFGSSLCCILPAIVIMVGISAGVSNLGFIDSVRPYLIASSLLFLGIAWYQQFMHKRTIGGTCCSSKKRRFDSKYILTFISIKAVLLIGLPYYSTLFVKSEPRFKEPPKENAKMVRFSVVGISCRSCEKHIEMGLNEISGIHYSKASSKSQDLVVIYDSTINDQQTIFLKIRKLGYKNSIIQQ